MRHFHLTPAGRYALLLAERQDLPHHVEVPTHADAVAYYDARGVALEPTDAVAYEVAA